MVKRNSKSFRRVYREDLKRDLKIPEVSEQVIRSFQMIFRNWKLFLPLMAIGVVVAVLTMGVTGFFTETVGVFAVVIFLLLWLVTIFLTRQMMAGNKVSLRDGLYNGATPLVSTFVVLAVVAVQCIPIMLLVIAYSAAIQTDFLSTPFYALVFWGFAAVMVMISGYLLPSSLMALVAVTTPGLYPFRALMMTSELMAGRRLRFLLRLVALIFVVGVIGAAVLLPLSALKAPTEVISVAVMVVSCFSVVYIAVYLYIYYRYLLDA